MSDLNQQTGKVIGNIERAGKVAKKQVQSKISNIQAYLLKALQNAPKKAKSVRTDRSGEKSRDYMQSRTELRIFYRDKNTGAIYDSGLTVKQFLKKIKGGYRATGAGSFMKEKVQTRVQGSKPAGTYADKNQRPGEFFRKGTGKFSDAERKKLKTARDRLDNLSERLQTADAKKTRKLRDEIRILDRQARSKRRGTDAQRQRAGRNADRKRQKLADKQQQLQAQRKQRLAAQKQKDRRYRIVVPSARGGFVDKPLERALLKCGAKPGKVPKTWSGGGLREYFIARNWRVKKISPEHIELSLRPNPISGFDDPGSTGCLRSLEYGGSIIPDRYLMGYLVEFRDTDCRGKQNFSHTRISLRPRYSAPANGRRVSTAARPWVGPTVQRVRERFMKVNKQNISVDSL